MPKSEQFVVVSDAHVHPWDRFSNGRGRNNDRLHRTMGVLRDSLQYAHDRAIPWVFAGDLVHTAGYGLNVVTSMLADLFYRYAGVEKIVVWGNHDSRSIGGKIVLEETIWGSMSNVPRLTVLEGSGVAIDRGGLTFSGAGGQPSDDLVELGEPSAVGVYHGIVKGSKGPNGYEFTEGLDADEMLARHRVVIVGDLHHPQIVQKRLLIPGSPEHHNFGDVGDHGWWVVEVPLRGDPKFTFHKTDSPQFLTVRTLKDVRDDGNFYRVLSGEKGEVPKNAIVVAPSPTVINSRAVLRGMSQQEVLSSWIASTKIPAAADVMLAAGRELLGAVDTGFLRAVRVKKLVLHNFGSYADAGFEVRDGVWLVLGKGRDYPSNGAGKTTLFEALFWLLFGRTTKGLTGDDVIRWGESDAFVEGVFESAGGLLFVTRSRSGSGSRLEVSEWDGDSAGWEATSVNEMTEKLNRYLGITPSLFQALCYFSQERLLLFASATDGERKEMLADLVGLQAYADAATRASATAMKLQDEIGHLKGMVQGTEERLTAERVTLQQAEARVTIWQVENATRIADATKALGEFDFSRDLATQRLKVDIVKKLSAVNDMNVQEAIREKTESELESLKQRRPVASQEEFRAAQSAAGSAQMEAVSASAKYDIAARYAHDVRARVAMAENTLADGKCPTCGQAVTAVHRAACLLPVQTEWDNARRAAKDALDERNAKIGVAADAKAHANDVALGWEEMQRIATWTHRGAQAAERLKALREEAQRIDQLAADQARTEMEKTRAALVIGVRAAQEAPNPFEPERVEAAARVQDAVMALGMRTERLAELTQRQQVYEYWADAFGKSGIQSLMLEEIAGLFNATRGSIIPVLTSGVFDVQFSVVSKNKAGDLREKTEFIVFERGERVPYDALSGGQRRRIDMGVMLTLVKAASMWMRVPGVLGMLVLDEVFGYLDSNGSESLMDALREVQTIIPAVYVISHDQQFQAMFDDLVLVEQDADGVSHLLTRDPATVDA